MNKRLIHQLQREIREIEADTFETRDEGVAPRVPFGIDRLDEMLGGGLMRGALHEVHGGPPTMKERERFDGAHHHAGAASAFSLALTARLSRGKSAPILWIQDALTRREAGLPYGPGLSAFGCPPDKLLLVHANKPSHVLWAMEEGLATPGLAAVIGELWGDPAALSVETTMTATRRLHLAAAKSGVTALFVRHGAAPFTSAARTRFRIQSTPSSAASSMGTASASHMTRFTLGLPRWRVTLDRNRAGSTGQFTLTWSPHGKTFTDTPALPIDLVPAFPNGPLRHSAKAKTALAS